MLFRSLLTPQLPQIGVFWRFQSEIMRFYAFPIRNNAFPIRNCVFLVSLGPWYPAGPLGPSYPAGSLGRIPRSLVKNIPTRCGNIFPTRETHSLETLFASFFGTHFGIFATHFEPHLYAHPDGFMGFWDPSRKIRSEKTMQIRGTNVPRSLISTQLVTKAIMKGILNSGAIPIP